MGRRSAFKLDVVSVRLVKESSVTSDKKINSPEDAVHLMGKVRKQGNT